MKSLFDKLATLVTSRPKAALLALATFAAILIFGMTLLGPQAGNEAFLPPDSEVSIAGETLRESFPNSAGLRGVTIIHRGEFLTPAGLAQIDQVVASSVAEPSVQDRLALTDPVISVASAFKQALGVDDL